mmetsp:Transcript_36400/g.50581  ORF Transcript_36400/g.50581 Transcript_36400/m.50581 type:complete len:220 (+) Transcript_36400:181-840(+)
MSQLKRAREEGHSFTSKNTSEFASRMSSEQKSIKRVCKVCEQVYVSKFIAICTECGEDFGCDECWVEVGAFCGNCKDYHCYECGVEVSGCERCGALNCEECGDFKTGQGGVKLCSRCQPLWMRNKPAGAFCKDCGSQRDMAQFCNGCGERVCVECESVRCETCSEYLFCSTCEVPGEIFCKQTENTSQCIKCNEDEQFQCRSGINADRSDMDANKKISI